MAEQPASQYVLPETPSETHTVQAMVRFLRAVRYRKGVIFVALAASCILGGIYYATAPRIYESGASLLVLQTGGEDTWSPEMSGGRMAQDFMDTYRNMLCSEVVVQKALEQLKPEHRVDLGNAPPRRWVEIAQENLRVSAVRKTNILEIAYRSKEPHAAAAMVDSLLTAYLDFMDKLHKNTAGEIRQILTKEKAGLEEQLAAKQTALLEVRRRAGELVIREGKEGLNVVVKRAVSLNEAMIAAHQQRLEAQSRLAAIERAIRNGEDLQQHALAMVDAVGHEVFLQRLGLRSVTRYETSLITQRLLEDKAKLQTDLQLYGPTHRNVREIQERIAAAEHYLQNRHKIQSDQFREISDQELGPILLGMARQRLEQALAHEESIHASYEQEKLAAMELDRTMAHIEMLQRDLDRLQGFYDVVVQRVKDIELGQENGMIRTRILSHPEVPLAPVWPHLTLVGLLCVAVGLCGGLAVVYVQDLLDDHFRSPEELRMQLGLPVLAMVRRLEPLEERGVGAVYVHVRPNAAEAEAFRTLRTALALSEDGVQRLVVSSSEPGDGKTTVISNLAAVYAQSGKRTLLIDADMRRPGLSPLLDLQGSQGLATILRETTPVAEAAERNLRLSLIENLDVIPSGPRPSNPTELLAGERFSELLAWAETRYDQILIDSPPALVSDTAIIGRLVDGVLLTVQPAKNRRRVVIRAAESFPALGIRVVGIVVNRLSTDEDKDYYGYGYGYGYAYGYGNDEEDLASEGQQSVSQIRPLKRPQRAAA